MDNEDASSLRLLKAIFKNTQETLLIINEMREMAAAYAKLGNEFMSDKLHYWADRLHELSNELSQAKGENLDQTVKVAQEASEPMIKAALGKG
jgi:hypothetical protein